MVGAIKLIAIDADLLNYEAVRLLRSLRLINTILVLLDSPSTRNRVRFSTLNLNTSVLLVNGRSSITNKLVRRYKLEGSLVSGLTSF